MSNQGPHSLVRFEENLYENLFRIEVERFFFLAETSQKMFCFFFNAEKVHFTGVISIFRTWNENIYFTASEFLFTFRANKVWPEKVNRREVSQVRGISRRLFNRSKLKSTYLKILQYFKPSWKILIFQQ